MGRGRGKGKKFTTTSHEDQGSGGEEKFFAQKQTERAAVQPLSDEMKEESGKVEAVNDTAKTNTTKASKSPTSDETGKKRKRDSPVKEKLDIVNDGTQIVEVKSNGFRHIGSRRKSKPRRAAEAVVECR